MRLRTRHGHIALAIPFAHAEPQGARGRYRCVIVTTADLWTIARLFEGDWLQRVEHVRQLTSECDEAGHVVI